MCVVVEMKLVARAFQRRREAVAMVPITRAVTFIEFKPSLGLAVACA